MKNAISVAALSEFAREVSADPGQGLLRAGVALDWQSATRARVSALPMQLGDQRLSRAQQWMIDEPRPLGGANLAANPQEQLLAALGGCLMVGFVFAASVRGVQLETLSIEVEGQLDLGGFLGVHPETPVRFQRIDYRVYVRADASADVLEAMRIQAEQRSPNAQTLGAAVPLEGALQVLADGLLD